MWPDCLREQTRWSQNELRPRRSGWRSNASRSSCDVWNADRRTRGTRTALQSSAADEPAEAVIPSAPRSRFETRKPQAHQVFRAIEYQDLGLLAEIAEYDFPLLLRPLSAGTNRTPLNHAIDCDASHRVVVLLLLGMFWRYINHLNDTDFAQPAAREMLHLLRVNFAPATARGVLHADCTLAASFLQVYVMSKGQAWLAGTVGELSIALRANAPGEAVALGDRAVRQYAGRTMKADEFIAALEDYIRERDG